MDTAAGVLREWVTSLGDTTIWGWLITISYAAVVIVSLRSIRHASAAGDRPMAALWTCICVLMAVLGLNKQLDFQTLLIAAGRAVSERQGWVAGRREFQYAFAKAAVVVTGLGGCLALYVFRGIVRRAWLELSGVAVVLAFALIRTGSISHLGKAAKVEARSVHVHAIELAGVLLVLAAALVRARSNRPAGR